MRLSRVHDADVGAFEAVKAVLSVRMAWHARVRAHAHTHRRTSTHPRGELRARESPSSLSHVHAHAGAHTQRQTHVLACKRLKQERPQMRSTPS